MLKQTNVEMLTSDQLRAYLRRIKLDTEVDILKPDYVLLKTVHRHHTLHIPFENLGVHLGTSDQNHLTPIDLSIDAVFDKIVNQNRGGYCYEMNKLFASVLKTIGFEVYSHNAGVIWGFTHKIPPTHRMLSVNLGDDQYLVDVGFGGPGQIYPIKMVLNKEQEQGSHTYRLVKDEDGEVELQKKGANDWKRLYAFNMNRSYQEDDYESHNRFMSTNPDSIFVKQLICTRPLENGRISLVDNSFKVFEIVNESEHIVENRAISTVEALTDVLKVYFAIDLPMNAKINRHNKQALFTVNEQGDTSKTLNLDDTIDRASSCLLTFRVSDPQQIDERDEATRKFHFFNPS